MLNVCRIYSVATDPSILLAPGIRAAPWKHTTTQTKTAGNSAPSPAGEWSALHPRSSAGPTRHGTTRRDDRPGAVARAVRGRSCEAGEVRSPSPQFVHLRTRIPRSPGLPQHPAAPTNAAARPCGFPFGLAIGINRQALLQGKR